MTSRRSPRPTAGRRIRRVRFPRRPRGRSPRRLRLPAWWRLPAWLRLPAWAHLPVWAHLPTGTSARRHLGMHVVLVLGMVVLSARLVSIQAVNADEYKARGDAQSQRVVELPSQRGRIYDRGGAVLATTVQTAAIFVDPSAFHRFDEDGVIDRDEGEASRREVARALAGVLELPTSQVREALDGGPEDQFAYVARQVDWRVSEEVVALELPGVHRLAEPTRTYPVGDLAAPVLGFTNREGMGVAGLEMQYEDLLTGTPGMLEFEVAGFGGMDIASSDRSLTPSVPGADLVLTIDREIQATAQRVAEEATAAQGADGVSIVVMDADTGELLAVASTPTFDPMDLREGDEWRARPFTDVAEPGSVQKAITIAAAWEEGLIGEDTVIEVPNTWTVGGKTWDSHGLGARAMPIEEILERSSNIGTMLVADMLGRERLHDWLTTFGYGSAAGVGFPGEATGLLLPAEQWSATSLPTIAIGHGVAVSTLQLASFYQVLANDGVRVQPHLVRGTLDAEGRLVPGERPDSTEVLSPDTALSVRRMLASVVAGEHGTGKRAAIEGYDVAGKTGTADKPLANGRGYSNQTTAVFAGMAPVEDPELVVAVMVDESNLRFGGVAAAPVFSEVMARALAARSVAPTTTQPTLDEALEAAESSAAAAARAAAERAAAERAAEERATAEEAEEAATAEQPAEQASAAPTASATDGP